MVETTDAVLVLNKSNSQEVKDIVNELNNENYKEAIEHKKEALDLGEITQILVDDLKWKVKKIVVNLEHLYHYRCTNIDQNIGWLLKVKQK